MIKSINVHPERLGATRIPGSRLPPGAAYRLQHAIKAGWRHDAFWLAEQYYKGKHAYASFLELHCRDELLLPARSWREDLIWPYQLKGRVDIEPVSPQAMPPLSLAEGAYAPTFMGVGDYAFTFPPGHHRLLLVAAQFDWMKRYADAAFAPFRDLLLSGEQGFLPGTPSTIRTGHLRSFAHLRSLAYATSFRQDVTLYGHLADLFDRYLADIKPPADPAAIARETIAAKVAEITAYLDQEVIRGNVPAAEELAAAFGVCRKTMDRYFKSTLGITADRYMRANRMAEAYRLLTEESLTPTAVAYQLSYDNLRTFERAFKSCHEITPMEAQAEYRKMIIFKDRKH